MSAAGRVAGKVALISGAAMGMGAAHARLLAAQGARVMLGDIRMDEVQAVAREIGGAAACVALDVTDPAQWADAVARAEASFGPVDVLVNNAGVVDLSPMESTSVAAYRRIIDINQIGPFLGMQAVLPSMRKAGRGSIINISSVGGLAPVANCSAYVATKFALRGMSKCASVELAVDNIRVNSVHPGLIDTAMNQGAQAPRRQAIDRFGRPDEVAAMVLFLASEESSFCTGAEYVVDGGFLNVVGEAGA